MSVSLDRGTTIGRLRLRAAAADPTALGQRGGTVLGTLDLKPPGLPEQAILCLRKLSDPLPGGLDLRSSSAPRPAAWEAAARGAVGEALRRAVRPALGPVPANADAVLFADRAELLACAARDALRGALAVHWWWTHLLAGERSPAAVVREWTRAPAYVPAAAELLAAQGEIIAFARAVAPVEAVRLLEAVLRTHALPALAFDVVEAFSRSIAPPSILPAAGPYAEIPAPPWRAAVPVLASAALVALTIEQKVFVTLVLLLRRAPALVRSERFAGEVAAWIESERRSERERDVPTSSRPMDPKVVEPPRTAARDSNVAPTTAEPELKVVERGQPAPVDPRSEAALETVSPEPRLPHSPRVDEPPAPETAPAPEILASSAEFETLEPPQPDVVIDSDFAGVFFLLNVAIALGLYSDFTSPVQCGIELDIWDFLALTGGAMADFGEDSVAPLLASLANRKEGEPPGAHFVPPEGQTLREWLAATVERIRERLALAGIEDPSRVVRRCGRITTTPAHLAVYFSLAAHPIEIRRAGLDRDPGWIPAAGRHVAFHFD